MTDDEVAAGAFAHGFVASTAALRTPYARSWSRQKVGALELAWHPTTAIAHHGVDAPGGPTGVLLGHAVDLERPTAKASVIIRRLVSQVQRGGLDAGTRYAAALGGRWAVVVAHRGSLHVLHDSHAAQSIYWSRTTGRAVVASHAALCADEAGADPDEHTLAAFDRIREFRPTGTVFLPGARTPFLGVRPVFANCRLELAADGTASHRRFGPLEPARQAARGSEEVYEEFEDVFERHVRLLTSFGRVGLSLTAGADSAVTFAALRRTRVPDAFGFTYVNPRDVGQNAAVASDLFGASRRAFQARLPHRVIRWRRPASDDPFEEIVTRMWPHLRPSVGAAYAMYQDLPRGFYELQSTVSETGTVFYRDRTDDPPTAERLTELWAGTAAASNREYVEAFEEFIDYAQFTEDALQGYDYHDLFYWEHRNTRWAAEKYQLGDVGHRVLLPFNARPILEPMLSLPYRDRLRKWILTEYLARRGKPPVSTARRVARRVRSVASPGRPTPAHRTRGR